MTLAFSKVPNEVTCVIFMYTGYLAESKHLLAKYGK